MRWLLIALAAVVATGILQWRYPDQTVVPIARSMLCDGSTSTSLGAAPLAEVNRVDCLEGRQYRDVTAATVAILMTFCFCALALMAILARRLVSPTPKGPIRRVTA